MWLSANIVLPCEIGKECFRFIKKKNLNIFTSLISSRKTNNEKIMKSNESELWPSYLDTWRSSAKPPVDTWFPATETEDEIVHIVRYMKEKSFENAFC